MKKSKPKRYPEPAVPPNLNLCSLWLTFLSIVFQFVQSIDSNQGLVWVINWARRGPGIYRRAGGSFGSAEQSKFINDSCGWQYAAHEVNGKCSTIGNTVAWTLSFKCLLSTDQSFTELFGSRAHHLPKDPSAPIIFSIFDSLIVICCWTIFCTGFWFSLRLIGSSSVLSVNVGVLVQFGRIFFGVQQPIKRGWIFVSVFLM